MSGTPADARIRHLRTPRRDAAEHNVLGSSGGEVEPAKLLPTPKAIEPDARGSDLAGP